MTFTICFCAFILIVGLISVLYTSSADAETLRKNRRTIESLPSVISTLGVIGTFAGITIGLMDFETGNLMLSVQNLLSGLKTAFWTSLCGMVGSMILRSFVTDKRYDEAEKGISDMQSAAVDICNSVHKMSEAVVSAMKSSEAQIKSLQATQSAFSNQMLELSKQINQSVALLKEDSESMKLIAGDNQVQMVTLVKQSSDTSKNVSEMLDTANNTYSVQEDILAETKRYSEVLRGEVDSIETKMTETNALLTRKFDEFSTLLKKSNTEALVEVMKNVTAEFQKQMNDLISRLVKENFDQLNKSVEKLNKWQQENKDMIEALTRQYREMETDFEDTSDVLNKVSTDTRELTKEGGKLALLVNTLEKVMIDDDKFIKITANLSNAAQNTQHNTKQLDESTTKLNQWLDSQRGIINEVKVLCAKLDELQKIKDYGEQFWQGTRKQMNEGVGIIKGANQQIAEQIADLDRSFYSRLSVTLGELDKYISALINNYNSRRLH